MKKLKTGRTQELKIPVTARNATWRHMILGVGKDQDYAAYLPECKEMADQIFWMIHEIPETFRLNLTTEPPKQVDVPNRWQSCVRFILSQITQNECSVCKAAERGDAAAHQITFSPNLPEVRPVSSF